MIKRHYFYIIRIFGDNTRYHGTHTHTSWFNDPVGVLEGIKRHAVKEHGEEDVSYMKIATLNRI